MKVIIVTGTPGTGKTTIAKKIAKQYRFLYIDVPTLVKEHKLYEAYDKKRKCFVVDTKKFVYVIIKKLVDYRKEKGIIIDSHLAHYLPKKYVDLCIVTKCNLKMLKKRLEKRGYTRNKVRENLDCEIFDVCLTEAKKQRHKILIVDSSKRVKNIRVLDYFV